MALKKRNKIDSGFSMSSMTDIVFLLLIFFMVTSTLIAPNALKLMLPESNNQTSMKPITTVSISSDLTYHINDNGTLVKCKVNQVEALLQEIIGDNPEACISLHSDESVPFKEVVKVMNIAKRNKYKLIVATRPEN